MAALSKNLTVMFVDIKGYTKRSQSQTRAQNQQLIQEFGNTVQPTIKQRGGQIIKGLGDAFLITFESSTDAVLAVGSSPAITHDTDAVLTVKPTVEHTTDAVLVLIVSHTTDAVLAYDLATTISAEGNLVDTGTGLEIRQIPIAAKGQVQQGEHAPQFYQPTRRIFRK